MVNNKIYIYKNVKIKPYEKISSFLHAEPIDGKIIKTLFALSCERLFRSIKALKIDESFAHAIIEDSQNIDFDAVEYLNQGYMKIVKRRPKDWDPAMMNEYVRELQSVDNHSPKTKGVMRMMPKSLERVVGFKHQTKSKEPADINSFAELLLMSHIVIDTFLKDEESLDKSLDTIECMSIAHHILDWYMFEQPDLVCRKTPDKLAMIAVYVMSKINDAVYHREFFDQKSLEKFAGWKAGGLNKIGSEALQKILHSVGDLTILFLNPLTMPDDWLKRLEVISPGLIEKHS